MSARRDFHMDPPTVADVIDEAVAGATSAVVPHHAHVATTGVVHPANIAYTQADQTALATAFVALTTDYNSLIDQLISAGLMASS